MSNAQLAALGDLHDIVQNLNVAVFVLEDRPADILRYLAVIERRAEEAAFLAHQAFEADPLTTGTIQ
jgi:hypothetical protein